MGTRNAPIPPDRLREIEAAVATEADPDVKHEFERRLLLRAQKEANDAALDRRRFRTAFEEARHAGHSDPAAHARKTAAQQRIVDLHDKRVRAIIKREAQASDKRRNKLAAKHEVSSKSAKPSLRRLPQKDRQYAEIVGEAEKEGTLSNVALVLSEIEKKIPHYRLPHWEKTTTILKVIAMAVESKKDGAQTINLRPNDKVMEQALLSPRGAVPYMQDRIRREFEKAFGKGKVPDFWMVIECDTAERFHLHGAVVTPEGSGAEGAVNTALRAAGGLWPHPAGSLNQQVSRPLNDPLWWGFYASKRLNKAKSLIKGKLFASTLPIRQRAEASWDGLRTSMPQGRRT